MAKNFIQNGNTITIANGGDAEITSGSVVAVGDIVAVAITDIAVSGTGEGLAEGVFLLPKLAADVISAGTKVYIKSGAIQLAAADAVLAGHAWESAGAGETVIDVKING
ncbi:recombinase RecA [Serratia sp. Leaf50]|uniref:DUF2190 family protein n=1 Tax=Rouxiella sp. S1S-2 TaxID=2653856 RepID=UPI0006F65F54|nr:capsid cement protein [Rouxiella sp. S1S-2]KAB7896435.1 DUF2190 family protein [Rouxiella sp. S1S-2]KQN46640.1 recombinase RecA [Serratia sp. Leaf50]